MSPFLKYCAPLGLLLLGLGCSDGFGTLRVSSVLRVNIKTKDLGSREQRLPISVLTPSKFDISIEAIDRNGEVDTNFSGYVRLSTQPGTIQSLTGAGVDGRSVLLTDGVADNLSLDLIATYGDTFVWAEDSGYEPVAVSDVPSCSNGIDDDGDGLVDFPVDPGCAFANDNSEESGTFAAGSSVPIFFALPRIADVRGVELGGGSTSYPNEQVRIDTGYNSLTNKFGFRTVVTRLAQDGFFATDLEDSRGYSSVFAFTFSTPPDLQPCDILTSLTGTAYDFFGFTELNFPTWTIQRWSGKDEDCLVPVPQVLESTKLASEQAKQSLVSGLVRVYTGKFERRDRSGNVVETTDTTVSIGTHFGPEIPASGIPGDNASNCDINGDGQVDFYTEPEKSCSSQCEADVQCTDWTSYSQRSTFNLIVTDNAAGGAARKIQVDGTVSSSLRPLSLKGKTIKAFTGDLRYFSGGNQYTIVAGCPADIVTDLTKDVDPKACFFRTDSTTDDPQ